MLKSLRWVVAAAAVLAVSGRADAGFVPIINGSFEATDAGSTHVTYPTTTVPANFGWEIQAGTIDVASDTAGYWNTPAGNQYIDLAGETLGTISQSFTTFAGLTYTVSFIFTNNNSSTLASMEVGVDDGAYFGSLDDALEGATFTVDQSPSSTTDNPDWAIGKLTFTAASSLSTLWFRATAANGPQPIQAYGVFLDNVVVTVPEPTSMAIAGLGVAGLVGARLRRRKAAAQAS